MFGRFALCRGIRVTEEEQMKRPYEKPVLIPFGYLKYMRPHRSVGHQDEPSEHRYVTQERQRRVSG
jgi:hypothetical protein